MDAAPRERRHHRKAAAAPGAVATGVGGGAAAAAAARAAYGDVFGGPPRFAAPFGGAPLDYAEVFGGVAATCSIPYLDLPPAAAADGFFARAGGKGDYGEIFARFDFADFALPYEDLFGGPDPEPQLEREPEEIASSSSGSSRSSIRKEYSQLEDESPTLPHQQNLDHHQHFIEHKFSPISFPSDTGSQHFVMSYNKSTERQPDDLVEMTACVVEPPMDVVFDSRNFSHSQATNHVSRIDNGTMASGNTKNPSSASVSSRSPKSDFTVGQKQQSPSWPPPPISGSVPANENHRNTDSHSSQSNVTHHDYAFLRVADVDAQTQPIKVQPPLRQKPKLLNKKEIAAKEDIDLVNHSCPPTSSPHTTSSSIPQADKKAGASPTSASAAMKEAMDFAEARLKAAKELLERKGDSFKLRKKSSHRSTRSTEIKVPVPVEVDTSEQKLSVKEPLKEDKNPDDSLSDKHKNLSAVRLDYLDGNGKRVLPLEKSRQMMPRCTESSQSSSTLEKLGNWRSGDQFYELTGDDQKCKTDEGTGEGDKHEQTNRVTSAINDKKSETDFSATDSDLERYEKLWEVNDSRDVGVKHVNPREDNIASVGKENMVHQEVHNSNIEEPVAPENAKESRDADEFVELSSISNASAKLDFIKDMSGSVPEACSSGNHANDHRDLGNSSPMVSPVAGTSQEDTNSNQVLKVPCDDEMQCTSGIAEKVQEPSEVSNVDISWGSNIKSLILEELEESHEFDAFPRGLSGVEQETETYGREKFSFTGESLLHTEDTNINEVLSEEVEKIKIEEKVGPCTHPDETIIGLDAEHPGDENDVTLQNDNLVDREESSMLNIFEVASKLIKRDLDQEMQGPIRRGEVENMEEGTTGFKDSDETLLKNCERTGTEDGSAHCNQEDQNSSESISTEHINAETNFKTIGDEVRSESFSGDEVILKDELAKSSETYAPMQHSMEKDARATSRLSNKTVPSLEETGEVCNGERELPAERSASEENKGRANKMEGKDTAARKLKAEQGPSPFEKSHSPLKSAEGPAPDSTAETLKKEELGVRRAKDRENITRAESANDKGSSRRTEEAKESDRRLEKERELAKEKERRKLEEEERERERRKDRLAVERATREAHERAFAEAREKAEKMALERIIAARQRASAEAREKEERANAEAAAERAAREAKIKADRAAVERATAEARERAIEKAKAEKALADARERRERYRSSFKSSNQDVRQESQFQRATSSNFSRTPDSGTKVVEVESALRHRARLERHQRTAERVTKALAEKNMRDLLAQREQAEKHRLSEFLDPEIKRWSNGKEGNLRALLSTLQYILGADSGWQSVPLTDLITAAAVKKAYRKATLCVHPDKLQQRGATIRQKYICEKVFDLLKDAWNKFTSEER